MRDMPCCLSLRGVHAFLWFTNLPTGGSLISNASAADTAVTATPHMTTGHRQLAFLRMTT